MPPHRRKRLLPDDDGGPDQKDQEERKPTLILTAAAAAGASEGANTNTGTNGGVGAGAGAGTPTTQASSSAASTPSRPLVVAAARRGGGGQEEEGGRGNNGGSGSGSGSGGGGGGDEAPWAPAEELRDWTVTQTLRLALLVACVGLAQALLTAEAIFFLVLGLASLFSLATLAYARVRERGLLAYLPPGTRQMLLETSLLDWLMDTSMADRLKPYAALSFGGLNAEERAFLVGSLPRDQQQALVAPGLLHALPASMQSLLLPRCPTAAVAGGGGCGAADAASGGSGRRHRIEELSEAEAAALRRAALGAGNDGLEDEEDDDEEERSLATASVTSDEASVEDGPALRYARLAAVAAAGRRGAHNGLRPPARSMALPAPSSSLDQQPPQQPAATAASADAAASAPWPHPSEVEDVTAYVLRRRMLRAWGEATRAGTEAVVAGVREEVRRVVLDRRLIYAGVAVSGSALAAQVLGRVAGPRPAGSRALRVYGSGLAFAGSLVWAAYEYWCAAAEGAEEEHGYDSEEDADEALNTHTVAGTNGGVVLLRQRPAKPPSGGRRRRRRAREELATAAQWAAFFVLLVLLRTGRLAPILRRLRLRLFGGGGAGSAGFFLGGGGKL